MAIAGMVLGIVAVVLCFIPCFNWFAFLPAILGIIFSALGLNEAKKNPEVKGMSIAGLICSIVAVIWVPLYWGVIVPKSIENSLEKGVKQWEKAVDDFTKQLNQ